MSEFSEIIDPDSVQASPRRFRLEPDETVRATIAKRLGLVGLPTFSADIELSQEKGVKTVRLTGHIKAKLVQSCISTLEPVESEIDYPFTERYSADDGGDDAELEIVIESDEEADVDLLPDEGLDIAEIAVQHLLLAIDPYPRALGAEGNAADVVWPADSKIEAPSGPFAKLAALRDKKT